MKILSLLIYMRMRTDMTMEESVFVVRDALYHFCTTFVPNSGRLM